MLGRAATGPGMPNHQNLPTHPGEAKKIPSFPLSLDVFPWCSFCPPLREFDSRACSSLRCHPVFMAFFLVARIACAFLLRSQGSECVEHRSDFPNSDVASHDRARLSCQTSAISWSSRGSGHRLDLVAQRTHPCRPPNSETVQGTTEVWVPPSAWACGSIFRSHAEYALHAFVQNRPLAFWSYKLTSRWMPLQRLENLKA